MEMYGYAFSREKDLQHHGIKGQKWGVRRFQNEDGSWTAAGRERYGGSNSELKRIQSSPSGRSKNPLIRKMGGRRINADYETRRSRGEALDKEGRTMKGAIGRAIGRDIQNNVRIGALTAVSVLAITGVSMASLQSGGDFNAAVDLGKDVAGKVLAIAGPALATASAIRTYQDISDLKTYRDSQEAQKSGK